MAGLEGRLWQNLWKHLSVCSMTPEQNAPISSAKTFLEHAKDNVMPSHKKAEEELELGENGTNI